MPIYLHKTIARQRRENNICRQSVKCVIVLNMLLAYGLRNRPTINFCILTIYPLLGIGCIYYRFATIVQSLILLSSVVDVMYPGNVETGIQVQKFRIVFYL